MRLPTLGISSAFTICVAITVIADPPAPRPAPPPMWAAPLRAAPLRPVADGRYEQIGPWIEPGAGTRGAVGDCSDGVAFDSAALDPDHFNPNPPDPNCATYSWFGPTYRNVRHANDFTVEPAYAGSTAHEVGMIWFNSVAGEPQLIALSTYENGSPTTCGLDTNGDGHPDTPFSGHLSTWVIDFGPRPYGAQYTHVSLCADPVGFRLPADGSGMYEMLIARSFDDTNGDGVPDTLVPATLAQPLLYYNFNDQDGDGTAEWRLAGTQTPVQFDDRNFNGQYDLGDADANGRPDECYSYDFSAAGSCPRLLSSAVMFWADSAAHPPCPGDTNGNHSVDLNDLTVVLSAFGLCAGSSAFNPAADLDASGCVDLNDLTFLLAHFGLNCP